MPLGFNNELDWGSMEEGGTRADDLEAGGGRADDRSSETEVLLASEQRTVAEDVGGADPLADDPATEQLFIAKRGLASFLTMEILRIILIGLALYLTRLRLEHEDSLSWTLVLAPAVAACAVGVLGQIVLARILSRFLQEHQRIKIGIKVAYYVLLCLQLVLLGLYLDGNLGTPSPHVLCIPLYLAILAMLVMGCVGMATGFASRNPEAASKQCESACTAVLLLAQLAVFLSYIDEPIDDRPSAVWLLLIVVVSVYLYAIILGVVICGLSCLYTCLPQLRQAFAQTLDRIGMARAGMAMAGIILVLAFTAILMLLFAVNELLGVMDGDKDSSAARVVDFALVAVALAACILIALLVAVHLLFNALIDQFRTMYRARLGRQPDGRPQVARCPWCRKDVRTVVRIKPRRERGEGAQVKAEGGDSGGAGGGEGEGAGGGGGGAAEGVGGDSGELVMCAVCFSDPADAVLMDCGHGNQCMDCTKNWLSRNGGTLAHPTRQWSFHGGDAPESSEDGGLRGVDASGNVVRLEELQGFFKVANSLV